MQPVTDPDLLAILNGGTPSGGPVYGPPPAAPPAPTPLQIEASQRAERAEARAQEAHDFRMSQGGATAAKPMTAAQRNALLKQRNALGLLGTRIDEIQSRFDEDFSSPFPLNLQEYAPGAIRGANAAFNDAGSTLMGDLKAAMGMTGGEANSVAEVELRFGPWIPKATDTDEQIRAKIGRLRELLDGERRGVAAQLGEPDGQPQDAAAAVAPAGEPPAPGSDMERPYSPADPGMGPATGGTRTVEDNPALAAEYRARLAAGQPASEIIPWLRSQGASPDTLRQAIQQIQYRRANPNVPIESYSITSTREEPLSLYEQAANAAGNAELPGGFSPGAYAVGAGQFLSGNTLDNLTSDPERARLSEQVMAANNPGSTMTGQVSGGVLAALSGEAGLARLGMGAGIGRATLADVAMGAANGAGMADDGSRLAGAAQGGLAAGLGSLAGAGAMNVAGRAMSPSGGRLADLYEAGVRPTPGQRFADSGIVGRAVNATEEALQSVPVVGSAISGARQEARDQFQVGAFNQALAEIGEQLPKGMKPGTDPHQFAQEAFSRVYDRARSGMRVAVDEALANDLSELAPDISTLGPQAQNKLRAIIANTVKDDLSGDTYKRTMSDLGKHIARLRKSAMGEEQQLADVLDGVRSALDSAARRHSDPEAVALLDAADAGYAKLVRIEQASARRGGDDGTFSPTGFDSAVQQTSGGVRSKAYLRGDALMQDYANQGKALVDRMPNSGTADRSLAATTVAGGAAYLEPSVLGVLGAIGAAYAPGVRRATKGAMAPGGPTRKAIAQQLKRRARLAGRVGAAGAVASLPGTTPAQ